MYKVPLTLSYDSLPKRDLLLKLTADYLSKLRTNLNFDSDRNRFLATGSTAIQYLKETCQYRKQLQLCLKNFDGRTAETFGSEFVHAVRTLYQDHLINLGQSIIMFTERNVKGKKTLDLNLTRTNVKNSHYSAILENLFNEYGENVLNMENHPWTCRIARIQDCSKDTMNRLEGKLRIIGQFACLDEAISFLEIRIGLHGKYTFKILVDSLDELITHFLIDSSNGQINQVKARKPIDELVRQAAGQYEILNAPTYLVNPEAYKSILRHRIKATLKKLR